MTWHEGGFPATPRPGLTSGVVGYVEEIAPGSGRRTPPRARLRSDAPEVSLNGDWDFRWSAAGHPEGPWATLPVPAHWVLHGDGRYGRPQYTNIRFPFP